MITAILKDSDFSEVDRAECQFTTTATVLDNGTQVLPTLLSSLYVAMNYMKFKKYKNVIDLNKSNLNLHLIFLLFHSYT